MKNQGQGWKKIFTPNMLKKQDKNYGEKKTFLKGWP